MCKMRGESENGHFDSGSILLLRLMCQQYIHILNDSFFLPVSLAQGQVLKFVLVPSIIIYICVCHNVCYFMVQRSICKI